MRIQATAAIGGYANMGGVRIGGRAAKPTGDGHYFLVNRSSGLCLAVEDGEAADGAAIEQPPYASLARQQRQIIAL
ncbi:RICIN domain-containing protein [Streptomyces sp. NBC_01431]|uniref:RICIN domain-containing protein n=1 Tax=Streptomyces sp. NBC_01431 TaxID=2903863 RepID=UPI002E2F12AA|nr:RICIN domain-containing protein [Streptomyces sp. NBC_01431]